MKIVFLSPFGIRPKGTLIARMIPLAVELQGLGHEVAIIAPPYTNPEDSGKTETVRGVRLHNISLVSSGRILAAPILAWRMFKAAMAERPDLVHLFKPKGFGGVAAMLHIVLQRLGGRLPPLFVDTDDWEGSGGMNALHKYSRLERLFFSFQERWLLPRAAGVTVASRTLQTQAWGMGIAPQRALYLPNGVDDLPPGDGKRVRAKLGIPEDAPVVLLYTRFFEFDQGRLHRIFAGICRQVPGVRFLVVGKGRCGEEEQLAEAAITLGFAQALCMSGWVEAQDIPDYLAAGDVAIYPFADTLVNRAKCPAKLAEIMRAAVPVVADNVGQLAEYIVPEVSGLLCGPDDWRGMADRVVDLLLDTEKRRLLGENGRRRMLQEFSWNGLAEQLNGFYTGERL